jgi:hypothetical protein
LVVLVPSAAQDYLAPQAVISTMASLSSPSLPGKGPQAMPGDYSKIQKVAVISAFGPKLIVDNQWRTIGQMDISSWNLNGQFTELIRKHLAGRFEFVNMPSDTQIPAKTFESESKMCAYLKALPNPGVDAYIVVRPVEAIHSEPGAAFQFDPTGNSGITWLSYEIDIIDAQTLRKIASADGQLRTREIENPRFPNFYLDNLDHAAVVAGTDPVATRQIRRALTWMLHVSVVETLRALQFGVKLPDVGDHSVAIPPGDAKLDTIRSVAVLSVIGDGLRVSIRGHALVKDRNEVLPGIASGMDECVESMARDILARHHIVKPAVADRPTLVKSAVTYDEKLVSTAGLTPSNDFDAYVLIVNSGPVDTSYPMRGGLAMQQWIPATGDNLTEAYASLAVIVLDARTLTQIASSRLIPGAKKRCEEVSPFITSSPNCIVPERLAPDRTTGVLSDESKAEIMTTLRQIVTDGIPETLYNMGLDSPQPEEPAN